MPANRFTDPGEIAAIVRAYVDDGTHMSALAAAHGCGVKAIKSVLVNAGVTIRQVTPRGDGAFFSAPAEIAEVVRRYRDDGEKIGDIAAAHGCSETTVRRALETAQVKTRASADYRARFFTTTAEIEELARRYADGEDMPTLAAEYGCSPTTVADALHGAGVETRPRGGGKQRLFTTAEEIEDLVRRHSNGQSIRRLAAAYGCSRDTVSRALATVESARVTGR